MNRHERLAARAKARHAAKNGESYIVAVHEAGHAIAKVLAAGELGYGINEAIDRIEIGMGDSLGGSVDGRMMLRSQGVTYSPTTKRLLNSNELTFQDGQEI